MRSTVVAAKWLQFCCVVALLLACSPADAQSPDEASRASALHREASELLGSGQLLQALEVAERARGLVIADVGEKHWLAARADALLGRIFSGLGHAASAAASFQRAVDNLQRHNDRQDMLVTALRGLAGALMDQGRYADASAVYHRALPFAERIAGTKSSLDYVLMVSEQAELYFYMDDFPGAEKRWTEALALAETVKSKEAAIVHTLLGMGSLRLRQGQIEDAATLTLRAHETVIATLGATHPRVATTLAQLGEIRRRQGLLQQARKEIENALSIAIATGGHWSINVARHYSALSSVMVDARDPPMALEYQLRSIGILMTVLGENSPELAAPMRQLASLF